jgi:5'-deoxynucleotidase YfbR-like HD superfamily hydrolase
MRKLETVTGQLVDIGNPDPSTINIEDIAWGLSRMSRFCGQTVTPIAYNVAQHSLFVAEEVDSILKANVSRLSLYQYSDIVLKALLHDAAEAYTGDLPSPVKHLEKLRPIIIQIETGLMNAIYLSLGIVGPTEEEEKLIKQADRIAQKIEAHAFMPSRGKHWENLPTVSLERLQQFSPPLDSLTSYKLFMNKFNSLHKGK